jgi:hypothetical protein
MMAVTGAAELHKEGHFFMHLSPQPLRKEWKKNGSWDVWSPGKYITDNSTHGIFSKPQARAAFW